MNYSINKFFNSDECSYFINKSLEIGIPFNYNPNESWDCRRIYDDEFKRNLLILLSEQHVNLNIKSINVSLTTYKDGRYLNLHKDASSDLTTVIVLNNNFNDGRFALSNHPNNNFHFENLNGIELIHLESGYGITFKGNKIYHGVLPVTSGVRYALNIWISEKENIFKPLKTKKSIL